MPTRIKISNDTSATLSSSNPTLAAGELCFEIDTGFAKLGDGTTPWNSLPYIGSGGDSIPDDAALPVASIRPLSSDRRPEGDIGTKNFIFAVERTGDLSAPASVSWSLESASDLESGQATSGTVGWLAGDGSGQQVEIAIKGDTTAEADQVCRIRIATPVGCTIGTAAASLTIIDDDAEHDINDGEGPTGYDQELAFGGVMLGTAVQDGQIGNLTIRNHGPGVRQNAIVLYLESDYPIVCMQTENRYDKFPLSAVTHNTGYSDHTVVRRNGVIDDAGPDDHPGNVTVVQPVQGGDLRWQVAKVTSAERDAAITLGPFVGETERINRAALAASWQLEFAKSGGTGSFGNGYNSFTMYPTIWFKQPIDPVALGWKIGDRIAFVVDNSARDEHGDGVSLQYVSAPNYGQSRWCSVNQPFRRNRPKIRSTYRYMRYAGCWWRNYKLEPEYCPMMLVGHKRPNGRVLVKGNAYGGYSGDVSVFLGAETGGITAIRQVLRIPNNPGWSGRRLLQADVSLWRSGGSTGVVTFAVKKAGTAIGDGADDGALLGAVDINAEELLYAAGGKMQRVSGDPHQWLRLPRTNDLRVEPGDGYYLELAVKSGSAQYAVGRILNYYGRQPVGLRRADHQDNNSRPQQKRSGNWSDIDDHVDATNYILLGMALHFDI